MAVTKLATDDDVARVLQVDVETLPEGVDRALEVASEWVRKFMREPNLGEKKDVTRSYWDRRDDAWIPVEGVPKSVKVRRYPGSDLEELDEGTHWTYEDGQGVRLRANTPWIEEDPRYGPGGYPRIFTEVQIVQTVTDQISLLVTEATANIVASMLTQGPRQARGILSETIGDYSYNRGLWRLASGPNEASPFFATAKGYLRPLGGGGLPFVT